MKRAQQEGFALVVVAALFLAFATMAAAVIDRSNAMQQIDAQSRTREKLNRISMALIEYSVFNSNRYPCPASPNIAVTNASFGLAVNSCYTGIPSTLTLYPGGNVVEGMVPVMTLAPYGIAPSDAFDAWNNRIMLIIDRGMTVGGAGQSASNRPVVTDYYTGETYRSPDFIVLSYGRDGLGAIPERMTVVSVACPSDGNPRSENCNGDLTFLKAPVLAAPNSLVTNYFDDLLSFYGY